MPSGQSKHNTDENSDLNACTDDRQETAIIDVDPSVATTADGTEPHIIPNRYPYCTLHLPFFRVEIRNLYNINHDRNNVY